MSNHEQKARVLLLLPDDPSDVDEFAAKAHEKVAGAIADLVDEGDGGKVIGLEGWWGSGKSTVVRLISNYLTQRRETATAETRVIVFDAWAHQGDPLRRTFLETVIDDFDSAEWLSKKTAMEFKQRLSGRSSSARTRSTSSLTREAQIAAATALLLPLGAALVANSFHSHHRLALGVGTLFLAAPFLVVFGFAFAKVLGVAIRGKRQDSGWRRALADLQPFSFFAKDQRTDTTIDEVILGEPTSVEFERLFGYILDKALNGQRRLLVVLDNLDRVSKADAQTVIATMQTFTTTSAYATRSWRKDVWTLIPYDPDGLDRLWDSIGSAESAEARKEGEPLPSSTAAAFLEKLFQVRFEAPPLVLSDWRGYLVHSLEQAMPDTASEEFEAVLRLRAIYPGIERTGLVGREPLTPRQLKQFVNQIVSIRRQRDDMPLAHIGYYVLLRRDRRDVAADLINGRLPHDRLAHLVGADVQINLAALHFGAPRDLAQQLLLGNALEGAFAANDATTVDQLKSRAGFVETLESLDFGSRLADGGVEFTRAVSVLQTAGAFEVPKVASWAKSVLLPLAQTGNSWTLLGPETGTGLAVLLDGLSSGDDAKLSELLSRVQQAAHEADTNGQLQLRGLASLADELIKRARPSDSVRIAIALPPDRLVASLAFFRAQASDKRSWSALEIQAAPADITEALVAASTTDGFREVSQALDVLLAQPERIDLPGVAQGCIEWLRGAEPTSAEQLQNLLGILDIARKATSSDSTLGPAADDGTLVHVYEISRSQAWYEQAAEASMLHLLARPAFPDPQMPRQAAAGVQSLRSTFADPSASPEVSMQQSNWLDRHGDEAFDFLMQLTSAGTASQAWTDYQLRELADKSALVVSPQQYLDNWSLLNRALGDEGFNALTANFLREAPSRSEIISGTSDPQLVAAVLAASGREPEKEYAGEVRAWARSVVMAASEPDWQAVLGDPNGGPLLALAVELAGTPEAPADPPGLDNAVHTHFQAVAADRPAWRTDGATLLKLTSLLGASARRSRASELCAWLEGRDGVVAPGLFTTYGGFLASERQFRIHPKLPNFIERLVARGEWDGVRWIVETANAHRDTLQPANRKAELENLRNKVSEKLAEFDGEEPPEALSHLSELLGSKN